MAAASPASQFSVLLRRSKFASFDPTISQVYTSHDGHLHRGNWGFKRPLPIRRRGARIMVRSVDSKEEQTEWKPADKEGRLMEMWDEIAITPSTGTSGGNWAKKLGQRAQLGWTVDTEFTDAAETAAAAKITSQAESAIHGSVSQAVPNIYAMSPKEFEKYIAQLRQSRPAFLAYLKEVAARKAKANSNAPAEEFTSAWDASFTPNKSTKLFLGSQAYNTYNSPDSRNIEQQPQSTAGLTYNYTNTLQAHLLRKAKPGHITPTGPPGVSFAGMHADVENSSGVVNSVVNFNKIANGERDPTEGVGKFKLKSVTFNDAPDVVSKTPRGLLAVHLRPVVVPEDATEMQRSNTHRPGSPAYVSHDARKIVSDTILSTRSNIFTSRIPKAMEVTHQEVLSSSNVLTTLNNMLSRQSKTDGRR